MFNEQQKTITYRKDQSIHGIILSHQNSPSTWNVSANFDHALLGKRGQPKRRAKSLKQLLSKNKVDRLVGNFIKKLRMNSTHRSPIQNLEDHKQNEFEANDPFHQCKYKVASIMENQGLVMNNYLLITWSLLNILQTCLMVFIFSIMTAFQDTENYSVFFHIQIVSSVIYFLDILLNFVLQRYENGKKLSKINEIYSHYLRHEFLIDTVSLLLFPVSIAVTNTSVNMFISLVYLLKLLNCVRKFQKFEYLLITSNEKQQYFGLFKVFLTNFIIGHFLSVFLNLMARLNYEVNWQIKLGVVHSSWYIKYIWGYYWGTNIMLTVGFGDITATNQYEAIILVFIQTFSCITLAYNISNVGALIGTIRQNEESKKRKLKIFHRMCKENEVSNVIESKISNFIEESYQIKEAFQHDARDEVIQFLPKHLQSQYRKEANKILFDGLGFLNNLSKKSLLKLAEEVNRKICHPEEIIVKKGNISDFCILQKGCIAFTCRNRSNLDGKIIELLSAEGEQKPKILSLDFIKNKTTSFNIKSINYSVIYYLSRQNFMRSLSGSEMDYQLFCLLKDKDEYILDENNLYPCPNCKTEYHTKLECSRLHFIPIKQNVINRYLNKSNKNVQERMVFTRSKQKLVNVFVNLKQIEDSQQKYLEDNYDSDHYKEIQELVKFYKRMPENKKNNCQWYLKDVVAENKDCQRKTVVGNQNGVKPILDDKTINKLEELLQSKKQSSFWEFQIDTACDFNFYFKEGNPDNLNKIRKFRRNRYNLMEKSGHSKPTWV